MLPSLSLHAPHTTLPTNHLSPSLRSGTNPKLVSTELKFLIPSEKRQSIESFANAEMQRDPYCVEEGGYQVESLYLDTPARDVLMRNPSFRGSKYRIRRYNESEQVFLEHKSKATGHLVKRRILTPLSQLCLLDKTSNPAGDDCDDHWFKADVQNLNLKPACQVRYQRTAYFLDVDPAPLRLTLDSRLSSNACDSSSFADQIWHGIRSEFDGDGNHASSFEDPMRFILCTQMILELKFVDSIPAVFKRMMSELQIEPIKISKYRTAMAPLLFSSAIVG